MPTKDYIDRHINAYTNPNLTTWAAAGECDCGPQETELTNRKLVPEK